MLQSMSRSLTDGPALLLIVVGMRCLELNRRWLAAGILGAAGLVREASILAAGGIDWPRRASARPWARALLTAAVCVLPALGWAVVVAVHFRTTETTSLGAPFGGFVAGLRHIPSTLRTGGVRAALNEILVVVALLVQVGTLIVHRQPSQRWWRVGIAFALLMLFTNRDAWADPFSTVPRAILPLTIAFNILVPRSRLGLVALVAGNLTLLSAPSALAVVHTDSEPSVDGVVCEYASGFHDPETLGPRRWRWASGSATLRIHNSRPEDAAATLDLDLESVVNRTVTLQAGEVRHAVSLPPHRSLRVHFGPIVLPPGDTALALTTNEPPWIEPGDGGRPLTFSLQNLSVVVSTKTGER